MKYCIISEIDKPSEKMICGVVNGKAFYLDQDKRKRYGAMIIDNASSVL